MTTTRQKDEEEDIRKEREQERDTRKARVPDDERRRLLEEKPFDFIERTRPEDPSYRPGQATRDNVNPNIPSGKPGEPPGPIVQPESSSGGVPPPAAEQRHTDEQDTALRNHMPSINEPPGSNITTGDAGPVELPPLVLSDIDPDTYVVGAGSFTLTATGSGFTPESVIVFDDSDTPTTFVSPTQLTADVPVAAAAAIVDVEVHRGEDMSDVLSFEFTAVTRAAGDKRTVERKPPKADKGKKKGK